MTQRRVSLSLKSYRLIRSFFLQHLELVHPSFLQLSCGTPSLKAQTLRRASSLKTQILGAPSSLKTHQILRRPLLQTVALPLP